MHVENNTAITVRIWLQLAFLGHDPTSNWVDAVVNLILNHNIGIVGWDRSC